MQQEMMTVYEQEQIATDVFALTLTGDLVDSMKVAGQFLNILVPQKDLLLRRPISINKIDTEKKQCRLIYRIEGQGTSVLSQLKKGASLDVFGPLGNGYNTDNLKKGQTAFLIGGGIGIPPLYELSRQLKQKGIRVIHFLGFTTKTVMYSVDEFENLGPTEVSTDDGTYGSTGNVGNLLLEKKQRPDAVFACGSNGLLKTVEQIYEPTVSNIQLSLEARMACGIGACYACVVPLNGNSKIKNAKVCDEGPIFQAGSVVL